MGHLLYGMTPERVDLDDRTLAHLQIVMSTKLRRRENFWIEFVRGAEEGGGREAIWVDHAMPLVFHYVSVHHPETDRMWIEDLVSQASDRGRVIISLSSHDA